MPQEELLGQLRYDDPGLPRGRHRLPAEQVQAAQRERLVHAAIAVFARDGYHRASIADVVAGARVSRAAFYQHFSDKEDCFVQACYEGLRRMLIFVGEHTAQERAEGDPAGSDPEARLRNVLAGFLGFLAEQPAFARCFLLEMPGAGPEAQRRYFRTLDLLAENTRTWHRRLLGSDSEADPLGFEVYQALVGGLVHLCTVAVFEGRTEALPGFEEPVMAMHLATLADRPMPRTDPG